MAQITSNAITFVDNTGVKKFLYIRYSNDGVSFTENNGLTPGEWLGICNSNSSSAPTDFNAYTWSKVKGEDGKSGDTLYTWIKYADSADGTKNMSDYPDGKLYVGISYNNKTEEESENPDDYTWSLISSRGIDHIEEYYVALPNDTGVTTDPSFGWDTVMPTLTTTNKYLWNYEETFFTDGDSDVTDPVIIGVHGEDGVGVADIENYYATTKTPDAVPTSWIPEKDGVPPLTNDDKYLWNYERIYYTDGNYKDTQPAIIGVYGDEGTDAVDFQIYSVNGFYFDENVKSITLETVASQAGAIITPTRYQWKYWDGFDYVDIAGETGDKLEVVESDVYASCSIKCIMKYDNINYEDYVSLSKKEVVYTSVVKFFDGSNIFSQTKPYLAAYVELYKGNHIEETIKTSNYYDGNNTIGADGSITTDMGKDQFVKDSLAYFIYKDSSNKYQIALGKCDGDSWSVIDNTTSYSYSIDSEIKSNIVVISKENVSKSKDIDVLVRKDNVLVAKTSFTVIDINDPIISDYPPENVKYGQLWLDTSENPYVLKIYTKLDNLYTFGEQEKLQILHASSTNTSNPGSASTQKTLNYSDSIEALDNGSIKLLNANQVTFSYNDYDNAMVLIGRFFTYGLNTYYLPEDYGSISRSSNYIGTTWYVYAENARKVQAVVNREADWQYFAQQNGGAVYTSIPINGYTKGDLWIISDEDISNHSDEYPNLLDPESGLYGSGTILKATASSSAFNESHWIDSMKEITDTIKNVKESFEWDEKNGLKIMRKVTDATTNDVTTPFYVQIDSTKMGFHSVTYASDGSANDVEVVHIGINSAVIKNANFIDNESIPNDYTKYENTNGALFDCNANFNKELSMSGTSSNGSAVGFVWKIESNGSLSLCTL